MLVCPSVRLACLVNNLLVNCHNFCLVNNLLVNCHNLNLFGTNYKHNLTICTHLESLPQTSRSQQGQHC